MEEWIWKKHKRLVRRYSQTPFTPAGIASISLKEILLFLFHSALFPGFTIGFKMIQNHLCKQLEPKEEDYHKLFNTLIETFDQLLAIANEKSRDMRFVNQSGQTNVEVKEPAKKQKTKHTPHCMVLRKHNLR